MSGFYFNEDKTMVAVLVSHGHGSWWGTANTMHPDVATNPKVVKLFMDIGKLDRGNGLIGFQARIGRLIRELKDIYGDDNFNIMGWDSIELEWVPVGTLFRITYDEWGEAIEEFNAEDWILAGGKEVL